MRASDLFHHEVRTADGATLGTVTDFRVVQDGPLVGGVQNAFRIDQLVVGRGGLADRLGYIRGGVRGPWLVRIVMSRLERKAHHVRIEDIGEWDEDNRVIVVRAGAELTHPD